MGFGHLPVVTCRLSSWDIAASSRSLKRSAACKGIIFCSGKGLLWTGEAPAPRWVTNAARPVDKKMLLYAKKALLCAAPLLLFAPGSADEPTSSLERTGHGMAYDKAYQGAHPAGDSIQDGYPQNPPLPNQTTQFQPFLTSSSASNIPGGSQARATYTGAGDHAAEAEVSALRISSDDGNDFGYHATSAATAQASNRSIYPNGGTPAPVERLGMQLLPVSGAISFFADVDPVVRAGQMIRAALQITGKDGSLLSSFDGLLFFAVFPLQEAGASEPAELEDGSVFTGSTSIKASKGTRPQAGSTCRS